MVEVWFEFMVSKLLLTGGKTVLTMENKMAFTAKKNNFYYIKTPCSKNTCCLSKNKFSPEIKCDAFICNLYSFNGKKKRFNIVTKWNNLNHNKELLTNNRKKQCFFTIRYPLSWQKYFCHGKNLRINPNLFELLSNGCCLICLVYSIMLMQQVFFYFILFIWLLVLTLLVN